MNRKIRFSILLIICVALTGGMLLFGMTTLKAEATEREITASGTSGEVNWTLYDDGELYIYGNGAMEDLSSYSAQPWNSYRSKIKTVNVAEGVTYVGKSSFSVTPVEKAYISSSVTKIGSTAFNGCSYLEEIDISYGVRSIGASAFTNCSALKSLILPDSIEAVDMYCFEECKALEKVVISNNMERINNRVFMGCSSLKDVSFSSYTRYLNASAFNGCTNLENVYYSGTLEDWCKITFGTEYSNPLAYADNFYLNSKPASSNLVIPDTCKTIKSYAFYGARFIESVEIPPTVTFIGNNAFYGCANLKNVNVSQNLETISRCAFEKSGLEEITIPKSVVKIDSQAFNNCKNLASIKVDSENKNYFSDSDGILFSKDKTLLIQYPAGRKNTEYTVSESVETIGEYAFGGAEYLEQITLPDNVKHIADFAFDDCTSLNKIHATDSVEHIGSYVFRDTGYFKDKANWDNGFLYLGTLLIGADQKTVPADCKLYSKTTLIASDVFYGFNITGIHLNNKLKHINDSAFEQCTKITDIHLPETVLTIGQRAFSGCTNVENLSLNYGLTEIKAEAFSYIKKITEIYIPQTVTLLSSTAFSSSGITDIHYDDSKAQWKRLANGATFNNATVHYTLKSGDESVIIHHTDDNFDWEAGNIHLVIEDLGNATSSYEQNGFYNRLMVEPIQVLDIKLVDGDGNDIQPLSDEKITVKIKASEEFMNLMKSGLSAVSEYDVEAKDIDFFNDCFVFAVNGETVSVAADESFLKKFKVIHWYSDATQPTDHESFTHKEISVKNGYIILETNHFSEYAVCTEYTPKNDYTVKWIVDGIATEQTVTEEAAITKPVNPEKEGYTFIGWTPEVPGTMPAQNLEFTAVWQVNKYTITFDTAGGTKIAPIALEYGAEITPPENPTLNGYSFKCWTPAIPKTMPAKNLSFTAVYENAVITGIKIVSPPSKTRYTYKVDSLDLSGIAVKAMYSDGTARLITESSKLKAYGFSADTVGTKTITVNYAGYTAKFDVTVSYAWWQQIIRIFLFGFVWY